MPKVIAAMSGGVDSSVAAALLKADGYQVIGVTMQLSVADERTNRAIEDAAEVAQELDIPHHVIDFKDIFSREVIAEFCHEYSRGRTPNPCIRCNRHIKFGALLERTKEVGADFVATGHYARIEETKGRYTLSKGIDSGKDQSYALYTLSQEQLKHTLMPLGDFTKDEVRRKARESGFSVANRPESQEICFIPDNDYRSFLEGQLPLLSQPGLIMDRKGNCLGEHRGIFRYTIGQRRGLGIAAREPFYVTDIDAERNVIIAGSKDELYSNELIASNVNWLSIPRPERSIEVEAKIRYLHKGARAQVIPMNGDKAHVKFEEPQMAITPGQAVVFYQENRVLGGGTIEQAC